ncbi:MAG TPA: MFS transporter [Tepidisphaeraceae bacterium]|jgi:MFS family permease
MDDVAPQDTPEQPDPQRPASASPTEAQLEQESPGGSASAGHDPYAALRYPAYCLFSLGWIVSVIGQQVQSVAIQWQIFNRMGTAGQGALALGLIGGVQAVPVMLLALPAGQLADRFDRRKLVMISQFFAFLCSVGLAVASHLGAPVGWMYLLLGLGATAQAAGWPARSAVVPQIVPNEVFANAMTWNSSAFQVAALAGPALGGFIVNYTLTGAYVIDACCSLAFFAFLFFVTTRPVPPVKKGATLSGIADGVRFVWRTKVILGAITLDMFAVLLGGATYLLPLFANDILHVGAVGFGWLKAAPALGAFVMAMLQAHLPPLNRAGATMLWAVTGFGLATIVFGLSHSFLLSFAMLFLTGAFDNISVVVRHTLVQMLPPETMRGRVSAVNNVFIGASNEIGGLESGLSAWAFAGLFGAAVSGAIASVVLGGFGSIATVIAVALIWPQVRRFGRLTDARPMEPDNALAPGLPVANDAG